VDNKEGKGKNRNQKPAQDNSAQAATNAPASSQPDKISKGLGIADLGTPSELYDRIGKYISSRYKATTITTSQREILVRETFKKVRR
jgi:hypothetical protein